MKIFSILIFNIAATVTLLAQSPGGTKDTPSPPIDLEVKTATASAGISPCQNENPLDGVDTWDLVLISKHILGIQPLDSPYKLIAADVNGSKSITNFDVVYLRKLIIGIHRDFSDIPLPVGVNDRQSSYRFVNQAYVFSNPRNPFEEVNAFITPTDGAAASYYRIKIGDVNETAINSRPATLESQKMGYLLKKGASGTVEVPVFPKEDMSAVSWQMSLKYSGAGLLLKGIRWVQEMGEFEGRDWHQPATGQVNILWYNGNGDLVRSKKGEPLFYLIFESTGGNPDQTNFNLSPDEGLNLAYSADGTPRNLVPETAASAEFRQEINSLGASRETDWTASVYPNPAGGNFKFELTVAEACVAKVIVFDGLGREVWQYSRPLVAGYNSISSNLAPALSPGQYSVRFETPMGSKTVRLVKI